MKMALSRAKYMHVFVDCIILASAERPRPDYDRSYDNNNFSIALQDIKEFVVWPLF